MADTLFTAFVTAPDVGNVVSSVPTVVTIVLPSTVVALRTLVLLIWYALPEARSIFSDKIQQEELFDQLNVLLVVPSKEIPPPSAVTSVAPPVEKAAPVALPDPPNVWSIVTVVPLTAVTIPGVPSVTVPPPLSSVICTPGAMLSVSLTLVI